MDKYPKAFDSWYSKHWGGPQCLHHFQLDDYKHALFNAWKAGRKHQKTLASAYGDIVRWSA